MEIVNLPKVCGQQGADSLNITKFLYDIVQIEQEAFPNALRDVFRPFPPRCNATFAHFDPTVTISATLLHSRHTRCLWARMFPMHT